jgi:hypothetical protein
MVEFRMMWVPMHLAKANVFYDDFPAVARGFEHLKSIDRISYAF